jgi:hypothetical protein
MPKPRTLIEGFIAGTLFGIYMKTGISIDEGDLIITTFTQVFENLGKVTNSTYNWRTPLLLLSIMFTLVSFIDLLAVLNEERDIQTGILLYGSGLILGLFLILIT